MEMCVHVVCVCVFENSFQFKISIPSYRGKYLMYELNKKQNIGLILYSRQMQL